MYSYGETSKSRLNTCHPDLITIFNEVIKLVDISILEGHRGKDKQDEYYNRNLSKLKWPLSKHNSKPSMAVDAAPWPIDWEDTGRFYQMVGVVKGIAHMLYEDGKISHKLRCGADWDKDGDIRDQSFNDLPHFELV